MASIGDIRRRMEKAYKKLGNWRLVADEFGVDPSLAWQIVERGYEPKKVKNRVKLGLPAMAPAPVCRHCGEVHVSRRCAKKAAIRRVRDLWDLPVEELRAMMKDALERLKAES